MRSLRESATPIGSLIVQDAQPIVILTSYGARVFTSVAKLKRLIAAGEVRYAFLNSPCRARCAPKTPLLCRRNRSVNTRPTSRTRPACLARGVLWRLPGVNR